MNTTVGAGMLSEHPAKVLDLDSQLTHSKRLDLPRMDQLKEGFQQKIAKQARCYVDVAPGANRALDGTGTRSARQPFATPEPDADTASGTT